MKFNPHDYQTHAVKYIVEHRIAALFLTMGLGKTVISLSAIRYLLANDPEIHKVLVIAPLRVANATWPEELQKWDHLKNLRWSLVTGTQAQRKRALQTPANIYIINRENVDWLINKSGVAFDYDMVIIDELSSFKSGKAKRWKALNTVRSRIKRIVGLTGTPSSNGLMDLWAQYRLLDGGKRLGRYISQYRDSYFKPDKRNGMIVYSYKLLEGAEDQIYHAIDDITMSLSQEDVLTMPKKFINVVSVEMSKKEQILYQTLKKDMILSLQGTDIDAVNAASLSNKLLQMANGAIYDEDHDFHDIHKRKFDAMDDIIEAANGHPVLVSYNFQHDKQRILKYYPQAREIKTTKDIEDWNKGEIDLALIHPMSAGHGLNLQHGGNILVWFGLTWSLEYYEQMNARLYRQGQQNSVSIYHIVTKGTIDEQVMRALNSKQITQNALLQAVKTVIGLCA